MKYLQKEYSLKLKPQNFIGTYGCMITFEDDESKNELRYKLTIQFIGKLSESIDTYRLDRGANIYINDKAPDTFIDKLSLEISKVIYPLEVKTSSDGKLAGILNFKEIVKRWREEKEKIKEYYKGDVVDRCLKLTDQTLSSQDIFFSKISKDWFINLYFNSLYKSYSKGLVLHENMQFPIAGKAVPVNYKVTQKLDEFEREADSFMIKIDGVIADERCALDLEQELDTPYFGMIYPNEESLKGKCNITYLLDKHTSAVKGYEAEFYTEFMESKRIIIKMFLLKRKIIMNRKKEPKIKIIKR